MTRRATAVVVAAAALALGVSSPALAHRGEQRQTYAPGATTVHSYTLDGASRGYRLYTPSGLARPSGVVVYLHGCNETAVQAEDSTHFDRIADQHGLVVVYPQQDTTDSFPSGNGIGCWNWFLPADQQRGSGEPALLAGITGQVVTSTGADPRRVYVEGISAGGDMSAILGATYPDVFAAVGVLAGCAYATCGDLRGTLTHAAMGSRARIVPLFQENGSADTVNNLAMAATLTSSWIAADQLAAPADGIPTAPTSVVDHPGTTPTPGSGDTCATDGQYSWTCPGGAVGFHGSYPTTVSTWRDRRGHGVYELWVLHGMQHAQPDADPTKDPYTDRLGPDITSASWDFFAAHPMPAHPMSARSDRSDRGDR